MQLIRTNAGQNKITLLNTVKSLSANLLELKNTLSNFLTQGSQVDDEHLQKLSEISSKQTAIMNRIRLGMEKQQSDLVTPLKTSGSQLKKEPHKEEDLKELQKVFEEQNMLEKKRGELLVMLNKSLESAFSTIQGSSSISSIQPTKNATDTDPEISRIVKGLVKDRKCKDLQKWAGTLYINTMSAFYLEHIKGKRNFDDTKMELSFVILEKYRQFVLCLYQQGKFDLNQVEKLQERFEQASARAISYLVAKCPMSKQTFDVSIFEKLANKVDESRHPDYDILHQLGVEFDPTDSSIGPTLKSLIGKIIQEVNSFYPQFKFFINGVMDGVDQKTGFTYTIQRKIMQGVSPYSQDEIITPGFFTKSNELMRTLVKWIEYLISPFKNPEELTHKLSIFRSPEGLERLTLKQREYMIQKFQKRKGKLEDILKTMNLFLQRTLSSIIVISNNPLGSDRIESFPFLDSGASSLLLICRYIWKTIEGFANEIIKQILKLYQEISNEYQNDGRKEAQFNLYGFFIEDLLSCECKGNKDSILLIYNNLLKQEQQGVIKILQISNKLLKPEQNVVILFKHSKCFLTFEIRLRFSGRKGDEKDEFNRFLRQIQKTILTPTFMLATNLINLNPIKQYLKKYKPYFKPNLQPFAFDPKTQKTYCKSHPQSLLKEGVVYNSFVCNMCFLFIQSYTHYFPKKFCTTCFLNVCFVCELKLLPQEQAFQYILSPLQKVNEYFEPLQLFKYQPPQMIKQSILKHLNENQYGYLLMVSFKNSTNQKQLTLVKSLIHHNQELVLTTFNNKIYDFKKLAHSLVVLLKPSHLPTHEQPDIDYYQNMYEIQDNYQETSDTDLVYLKNRSSTSVMVIDYKINQPSKIKQIISRTEIQRLIKSEEKVNEGKLAFDRLIVDFDLFTSIKSPDSILVLDFNQCELDGSNNFTQLNIFSNLQELFVSNTPTFKYNKTFQFNNSLVSINITQSELSDFQFDFPKLKQLRITKNKLISQFQLKSLPKLHTLKLSENQINSFWNLSSCELPALLKLDLKCNNIDYPLPVLSFEKLRVLDLSENNIKDITKLSDCVMPNLKQLILNNNQIQVLPEFRNLQKLEMLKISKNQLVGIDIDYTIIYDSLKVLDLSYNNLSQITAFRFTNLTHLYLNNNKITDFTLLKHSYLDKISTIEVQFNPIEKGKMPLFDYADNVKIHPGGLHFNVNPKTKCTTKEKLNCSKCLKEIQVTGYYVGEGEKVCAECYGKENEKEKYREIFRLDQDIMGKYS